MFVMSVKTTRKRIFILAIIVILIVVLLGVIISGFGTEATTLSVGGIEYSLKAGDNQERRAFLRQFGWDCSEEPVELVDVRIPSEFNDVYVAYNDLQKKLGFDLEQYKGTRVKRCTYDILNYPGEEEGVRANLLIRNGLIIGGDICSVALDGFMHGFTEGNPSLAPDEGSSNVNPIVVEGTQGAAQEQASSEAAFNAAESDGTVSASTESGENAENAMNEANVSEELPVME